MEQTVRMSGSVPVIEAPLLKAVPISETAAREGDTARVEVFVPRGSRRGLARVSLPERTEWWEAVPATGTLGLSPEEEAFIDSLLSG